MRNKITMEMSICQAENGYSLDKNRKAIFFKLKAVPNTPKAVSKGTRLRRDWKGKNYEGFVRDDGKFEYAPCQLLHLRLPELIGMAKNSFNA